MSINLVRIDFRLIHGQIVTKWIRSVKAKKIMVANDALSQDPFMSDVYVMSAPPGIDVEIVSVDEFVNKWNETKFEDEDILLLFKDVNDVYRVYQAGVKFDRVQIGGLGGAPGRKVVFGPITLDQTDAEKLTEINNSGMEVYFHQVPEEASGEFDKVMKKVTF